jgi:hypothetical protein
MCLNTFGYEQVIRHDVISIGTEISTHIGAAQYEFPQRGLRLMDHLAEWVDRLPTSAVQIRHVFNH